MSACNGPHDEFGLMRLLHLLDNPQDVDEFEFQGCRVCQHFMNPGSRKAACGAHSPLPSERAAENCRTHPESMFVLLIVSEVALRVMWSAWKCFASFSGLVLACLPLCRCFYLTVGCFAICARRATEKGERQLWAASAMAALSAESRTARGPCWGGAWCCRIAL